MKTPSLPTLPKHLKVSKTVLLVAAGIAILVAITIFGIVRQEQANTVAADQRAADQAVAAKQAETTQAEIAKLKADNAKLQGNVTASCSYLNTLATAKATRGIVIVPTASGCQPATK